MGLKIELKPGERVMLGECVIANHDHHTRLLVEGTAPILRERDIMTESRADTPCLKRDHLFRGAADVHFKEPGQLSRAVFQAGARHHSGGTKNVALD